MLICIQLIKRTSLRRSLALLKIYLLGKNKGKSQKELQLRESMSRSQAFGMFEYLDPSIHLWALLRLEGFLHILPNCMLMSDDFWGVISVG